MEWLGDWTLVVFPREYEPTIDLRSFTELVKRSQRAKQTINVLMRYTNGIVTTVVSLTIVVEVHYEDYLKTNVGRLNTAPLFFKLEPD